MTELHSAPSDTDSDDALVARLYELTCGDDSGELARIDAMVYERLLQAYGADDQASVACDISRTTDSSAAAGSNRQSAAPSAA